MMSLTQMLVALETTAADTAAATTAAAGDSANAAAATAQMGFSEILTLILPLVLMFAVFYFLLIRPQRKKDKKVKDMLAALKPGDRICTIGGIYGTISSIKDDTIEISVGRDNVKLVFARWGIRNVEEVLVENDSEVLN